MSKKIQKSIGSKCSISFAEPKSNNTLAIRKWKAPNDLRLDRAEIRL